MAIGTAVGLIDHARTAYRATQVRTLGGAGRLLVFDIVGLEGMLKAVARVANVIAQRSRAADDRAGQDMVDRMRADVPRLSGRLHAGITWRREGDEIVVEASAVRSAGGKDGVDYARFVEHGTRAGVRGARVVTVSDVGYFEADTFAETSGRRGTPTQRARRQARTHPGTPAQPFFFGNAREVLAERGRRLEDAIVEAGSAEGL